MFHTIVVGFDGSAGSRKALQTALRLAREQGARVWTVGVEEKLPRYVATIDEYEEERETANDYFRQLNDQAAALARAEGVPLESIVRPGHPAKTIVEVAAELQADLVVVGHTGHSDLWGTFLGTNADKVMRHATCSVLVVR
jgi:nucleotide-binding universal stress UspA family protein